MSTVTSKTSNSIIVRSVEEAEALNLSYPVEVRAAFSLNGQGFGIAYDQLALIGLVKVDLDASPSREVRITSGGSTPSETKTSDEPKPPEALNTGRYAERLWGYKDQIGSYSEMGRLYERDRADFWYARFKAATPSETKADCNPGNERCPVHSEPQLKANERHCVVCDATDGFTSPLNLCQKCEAAMHAENRK